MGEKALAEAKSAEAALAEINAKAPLIDAQRAELEQAQHAATVDDVLKHRTTRRQELATARRDLRWRFSSVSRYVFLYIFTLHVSGQVFSVQVVQQWTV